MNNIDRIAVTHPATAALLVGLREAIPDDVQYLRTLRLMQGYADEQLTHLRINRWGFFTLGVLVALVAGFAAKVFS